MIQNISPVVRGRFSHTLVEDLKNLISVLNMKVKSDVWIKKYENEVSNYIGIKSAISFAYARTAFWAILKSLNLEPGEKIIMPSITIKPMVDVVLDLKLIPVFVDSDLKTGCVNIDSLKSVLSHKPKIFMLTYLFGVVPNVDEILKVLEGSDIKIIEDISQCFNGKFKDRHVGTFGYASILSTSSVKTLDTYGGGMVLTNCDQLANDCAKIRDSFKQITKFELFIKILSSFSKNLLTHKSIFAFTLFPIIFIATFFNSDFLFRFVGNRSTSKINKLPPSWFRKLHPIQAQYGVSIIPKVKERDAIRIQSVKSYSDRHQALGTDTLNNSFIHSVFWQAIVMVKDTKLARKILVNQGIDCSISSLVLVSELPYAQIISQPSTDNAKRLFQSALYLPCYYQLKEYEINRIKKALHKLYSKGQINR